jgi:hypothetical protein
MLSSTGWVHSVAREHLIDLAEWADARSRPRLTPYPYAFTASLWSYLEAIPFAELGRSSLDRRIEILHRSASRALESALAGIPEPTGSSRLVLHFASPLQSGSGGPRPQQFGIQVEFTSRDRFVVVVGLGSELASKPLQRSS